MKTKVLKGAEENQVDVNVFRITVVATFGCIDVTQSTLEEELRTHYPVAVVVVYVCGLTPVKFFLRLRLQNISPA